MAPFLPSWLLLQLPGVPLSDTRQRVSEAVAVDCTLLVWLLWYLNYVSPCICVYVDEASFAEELVG